MVFFRKDLRRTVMVHPQFLGAALRKYIKEQVVAEVEGTSIETAGFIITVLSIDENAISQGLIDHLTGFVKYHVTYTALMFRPFKNEVIDASVKAVSDVGFFAEAGPLSIFVSRVVSCYSFKKDTGLGVNSFRKLSGRPF